MLPMQQATYRARAAGVGFGTSSKGNTQIGVTMEVTEGEFAGLQITWIGHFTDKTSARTIESLQHMGWQGDDLAELDALDAAGCQRLLAQEVEIVCKPEEYNGEWSLRVQWVNAIGGGRFTFKEPVTGSGLKAFAAQMKATVRSVKASGGAPRQASTPAQSRAATAGGGGWAGNSASGGPKDPKDDLPF